MGVKHFIEEWKAFGFEVAWFNARFDFAYWLLGAKSMEVSTKKKTGINKISQKDI